MIQSKLIPGRRFGKLLLHDLVVFYTEENAMLLCPKTGTTLGVKKEIAEAVERGSITSDFAFLMVQRALAEYENSRPVAVVTKHTLPNFFLVDMTKKCNLACVYCFRETGTQYVSMSKEVLEKIGQALYRYHKKYPFLPITIQAWGGEPVLELESIVFLRNYCEAYGFHPDIVVESNGTLITSAVAHSLYENDIKIGISIDGNAEVQNLQRSLCSGQPSSSLVEQGIKELRKAGYKQFGTITVVTKYVAKQLKEVFTYFTEELRLNSVKLNMMRCTGENDDLALVADEIEGYTNELLDIMYQLYQQKVFIVEQNISQRLRNLQFRPNDNICNSCGCHGGYKMVSIDTDGKVYPCELSDYPDHCIGEVGVVDFDEMVQEAISKKHKYFADRRLEECRYCPWHYYCHGGCRASGQYSCGDVTQIDTTECAFNKALYPKLVEILLKDPDFANYLVSGEG